MEIQKTAIAGTLESSDAQITIEPFTEGLDILIESSVMNQYGRQIKATIIETLENLNVTNAKVLVIDKGALHAPLNHVWNVPSSEASVLRKKIFRGEV